MKFTDVKTLEHFLKEYSYKSSGIPTPSGDQTMGASKKDSGEEFATVNISDVDNNTKVKDLNGEPLGTVVSKVGKLPAKDSVVVQTDDDKTQVIDPNTQVDIDSDAKKNESKLSKLAKRKNKKQQIKKIGSKLKKLARRKKALYKKLKTGGTSLEEYKIASKVYSKAVADHSDAIEASVIEKQCMKSFYAYARSRMKHSNDFIPPLSSPNGPTCTDDEGKCRARLR